MSADTAKDCFQKTSDFGTSYVRDICAGTVHEIPWGSADWTASVLLTAAGVAFVAILFGFAFRVWTTPRW